MPILHGANGSPFVRKVRVICAEKSIAYEQNPLIPFGVSDEYRAKSPLGKIPCWEDGDYVLPDSSCIGLYLEKLHPTPALYPADARELGRALWYEEYADSKLTETVGPFFFERFVKKNLMQQEPDEERLKPILAEQVPPVFDYLEREVTDREYLVGNRFSIADIATASPFVNFALGGESVGAGRWPNLAAYLERVHSRPSYKGVLEAEQAPA
ncbi:MAG: glutathione S-transferase family protein [Myxococcota bacterium]